MYKGSVGKAIDDLIRGVGLSRIWIFQAYHDITSKYQRTILGPFWLTGSVVATSVSLSIVFGAIFKQDLKEILPYIMAGIIFFNVLSYPLGEAPEMLVNYSGVIRNNAYPFTYYAFESVTKNLIMLAHNLIVFYVIYILLGSAVIPNPLLIPGFLLSVFNVLIYGQLVAMLSARYRDLRYLFPYVMQLLFFMTPIFWHGKDITGPRRVILHLNPFTSFLDIMRTPILGGYPDAYSWQVVGASTVVGIILWLIFFSLNRHKIPFWV